MKFPVLAVCVLALILTSCSGGGGGAAGIAPPPPVPVTKVVEVGPGPQQQATIQDAIDLVAADPTRHVIAIAPGTYGPFVIDSFGDPTFRVRILALSAGQVIVDASTGPVWLKNLVDQNRVELSDLTIVSSSSAHPSVLIENCNASAIVLDELNVQAGPAQVAVKLEESIRVAIQRSSLSGQIGLRLGGTSMAVASRTTMSVLEVAGFSFMRTVDVITTSDLVGQFANLQEFPGVMPDLNGPELVTPGQTITLQLQGDPQSLWFIGVSARLDWYEVPLFQFPLVGLLDLFNTAVLYNGMFDGAGFGSQPIVIPLGTALDEPLAFQGLSYDPVTTEYRWTNVISIVGE